MTRADIPKVAVVGLGPIGLGKATLLVRAGPAVTGFEQRAAVVARLNADLSGLALPQQTC